MNIHQQKAASFQAGVQAALQTYFAEVQMAKQASATPEFTANDRAVLALTLTKSANRFKTLLRAGQLGAGSIERALGNEGAQAARMFAGSEPRLMTGPTRHLNGLLRSQTAKPPQGLGFAHVAPPLPGAAKAPAALPTKYMERMPLPTSGGGGRPPIGKSPVTDIGGNAARPNLNQAIDGNAKYIDNINVGGGGGGRRPPTGGGPIVDVGGPEMPGNGPKSLPGAGGTHTPSGPHDYQSLLGEYKPRADRNGVNAWMEDKLPAWAWKNRSTNQRLGMGAGAAYMIDQNGVRRGQNDMIDRYNNMPYFQKLMMSLLNKDIPNMSPMNPAWMLPGV